MNGIANRTYTITNDYKNGFQVTMQTNAEVLSGVYGFCLGYASNEGNPDRDKKRFFSVLLQNYLGNI